MIHISLGSYSLSVTSFQILTPKRRFSLLQVQQGPAQTSLSIPQQRSPLFLSTSPTRDALYLGFALAMLPLVFFSAFFCLLLQKPLPGGNSSPVQPTSSWDPTLPAAVCGHIAHSRTFNSTIRSKVTLAVSSCWPVGSMSWSPDGLAQNISGCFLSNEMSPIYCCWLLLMTKAGGWGQQKENGKAQRDGRR